MSAGDPSRLMCTCSDSDSDDRVPASCKFTRPLSTTAGRWIRRRRVLPQIGSCVSIRVGGRLRWYVRFQYHVATGINVQDDIPIPSVPKPQCPVNNYASPRPSGRNQCEDGQHPMQPRLHETTGMINEVGETAGVAYHYRTGGSHVNSRAALTKRRDLKHSSTSTISSHLDPRSSSHIKRTVTSSLPATSTLLDQHCNCP
jgi:hypothetical protein